jgi:Tfp pilus assembly PilM family ATPase
MNKYKLGLEITEKNLYYAVILPQKQGWKLLEAHSVNLDENTNLLQALQQIQSQLPRAIKRIVIGLSSSRVLMKEIRIDSRLTYSEIYLYLQQQSAALFGKLFDDWCLDFEPALFTQNNVQQSSFRVVVASRDYLYQHLKIFQQCKFRVSTVSVDVLALARLAPSLAAYQADQPQGLLLLRNDELLFIVAQNGNLIYAKRSFYSSQQVLYDTLKAITDFFNGLYPQHSLQHILFIGEGDLQRMGNIIIQPAILNQSLWQIAGAFKPQALVSLGLAIYEY